MPNILVVATGQGQISLDHQQLRIQQHLGYNSQEATSTLSKKFFGFIRTVISLPNHQHDLILIWQRTVSAKSRMCTERITYVISEGGGEDDCQH